MKIGWIGTGIMGKSMAEHLIRAGYSLLVYNRTPSKSDALVSLGARFCSIPELASNCDVVFTMLGYPKDLEEVILSPDGVIANLKPGSLLIDHTTSSPSLAIRISQAALEKNIEVLDAPVSGGDVGAREARLAIMVGGTEDAFNRGLEIMRRYGTNIELMGPAGSGQHTKVTNQIVIAGNMIGMVEGISYAVKSGLDPLKVIQLISNGAAMSFSLKVLGPRVLKGDLEPGFFVEHFVKDLGIALEECKRMNLVLPGLAMVNQFYLSLIANGDDKKGSQALIKVIERLNGIKISGSI
jgi:3-hydroxyisobutyrate dehydrogenase